MPRPADVVVSDLRGVLPFMQGHIAAIAHARAQLLAPGGALIPARDTLWAAPVEDADAFKNWHDPWSLEPEGVSLRAARRFAVNAWHKGRVTPASLLGPAGKLLTLDYATASYVATSGRVEIEVTRAGAPHGVCVWFDAELVDGVGFSNSPEAPPLIYGSALFPLDQRPAVAVGDRLAIELGVTPAKDDYDWKWRVTATAPGGTAPYFDERHHSMMGRPLAPLTKQLGAQKTTGQP